MADQLDTVWLGVNLSRRCTVRGDPSGRNMHGLDASGVCQEVPSGWKSVLIRQGSGNLICVTNLNLFFVRTTSKEQPNNSNCIRNKHCSVQLLESGKVTCFQRNEVVHCFLELSVFMRTLGANI